MDMKKKKLIKLGVTAACLIVLYALCIYMDQAITATSRLYMLITVVRKSAVYALVAVSMNLLNGFTGLFSLGQAGFMLIGAYTYAIFSIPSASIDSVYQYYDAAIHFSFQEAINGIFGLEAMAAPGLIIGALIAMLLAGIVAAFFAWLIGLPVLRLKSDYLAIATLGFAEIIKAIFQWQSFGPITNGSNVLRGYTRLSDFTFNIGGTSVSFATFVPVFVASMCILVIVLLINSSYGRAFKAIREDEIAAEAMGVRLFKHKQMAFCISCFFAGVGGALLAMFMNTIQAAQFKSSMTYEILLIVVLGGLGSVTQLHSELPVHRLLRVVAARARQRQLPRHRIRDVPQRLPAGRVLGHHHGRRAVLPQGHHGPEGAARSLQETKKSTCCGPG